MMFQKEWGELKNGGRGNDFKARLREKQRGEKIQSVKKKRYTIRGEKKEKNDN